MLVPRGHPLAKVQPLTLAALARHPIVTYDFSFTGRSQINAAFDAAGLVPNVVLTALDSDVIKTYVEMGLGVGIIAKMAWDPARDAGTFEQLDAAHLFAPVDHASSRCAAGRSCAATSTISSRASRRRSIAPPSTLRSREPGSAATRERTPRARSARGRRRAATLTRAAANVVVRRAARLAVDAGAVRDRRLPARLSGDRAGIQRSAARRPADALRLPRRLRVHDALARRAVRRARTAAGRAGRSRHLRVRDAWLRDRRQHRVAVAVPRAAGVVGRHRPRRRAARSFATASTVRKRSGSCRR